MKILITGAGGYVAKKFIENVSGDPAFSIVGISRNTAPVGLKHNILFIQADLTNPGYLTRLPTDIDCVLFLAQSSAYRNFPDGAPDMFAINVGAVVHLLDWSVKNKIKKFIFASTGNVYKPQSKLLTETDPTETISYYAATKLSAEHLIMPYQSHFKTLVLRIFSVYGPGQQGMMIPTITEKIRSGEMITLAQNKGILLTPVYIRDAVDMLKRILQADIKQGVYNFCGNEIISLSEIVSQIGQILTINPKVNITADPVNCLMGDGKKLYDAIQYDPVHKMVNGLKLTLSE